MTNPSAKQLNCLFDLFKVVMLKTIVAGLAVSAVANADITALDGFGNAVDWFAVIKLPTHVQISGKTVPTPCNCAAPSCLNVRSSLANASTRSSGLCYLYADANNPTFRYFDQLGYDCLGQGGNDPVSRTLKQRFAFPDVHWVYHNDQFNGIAHGEDKSNTCSGSSSFSAHAKGAMVYEKYSGGVFLQSSTPNFPDPSPSMNRSDPFVRLGCQIDNNLVYSQHFFAISLGAKEIETLGHGLQTARVCSANHFRKLKHLLASPNLMNDTESSIYHAFLDSKLPKNPDQHAVRLSLPLKQSQSLIHVIIKNAQTAVPPWTIVSDTLGSDISVASWMDDAFGTPTVCAGDNFGQTPHKFCLEDRDAGIGLFPNGTARHNVENLLSASWKTEKHKFSWHLVGGVMAGNHAKWGLSTPRGGPGFLSSSYVIFGDMNSQGFPCSRECSGSQGGRGGSFLTINNMRLHQSIAGLVEKACVCARPEGETFKHAFISHRMCNHGCAHHMEASYEAADLPVLFENSTSYWTSSLSMEQ